MTSDTAVIVSTYENSRALDLVLRAWARQQVKPRWVVVADDGSGPETAAVVRRWGAEHVRLEHDRIFGKCRIVNAAVLRARELGARWALFTDGDWLPARDLLARHLEETRPSRYVSGGCIRLSREVSEAMRAEDVDAGAFEREAGNKPQYALPRALGHFLDRVQPRRAPWKGGNSSAWVEDFVRVGGYDERFGWGLEDNELGARLENAGVRGFSIRYTAPVWHLWHERPWMDPAALAGHQHMLEATRRTRATFTEHGIGTPVVGGRAPGGAGRPPGGAGDEEPASVDR
ncbi:MAG TPA: galactosyltransferase-related protein [Candidatus Eisenbacteria bacterium]|nr:galactosyltransferase-related protein [Candidatus Eisenbacteria bacterium]